MRRMLAERVLRITVKPFMDINTMIEERLIQCCVHVATVNDESASHQCAHFVPCKPGNRSPTAASLRPLANVNYRYGRYEPRAATATKFRREHASSRHSSASSLHPGTRN